jgi:error-prone DNA polymerase
VPAAGLRGARGGATVTIGGLITHRQQPPTAGGVIFLNVEDETGMANVICPPRLWQRHHRLITQASALTITGRVERLDGAVSLLATRLQRLPVVAASRSRDFR